MCTEVGQKKKKCSGGGAGQSGVHDYGFYGRSLSFIVVPVTTDTASGGCRGTEAGSEACK